MSGEAAKVFRSQGIQACQDCKHAVLPFRLDDFHINAQCKHPDNIIICVSPVTLCEYPEYKQQFCKDMRSEASLCGPKGVWFEPITAASETLGAAKETSESSKGNGGNTPADAAEYPKTDS